MDYNYQTHKSILVRAEKVIGKRGVKKIKSMGNTTIKNGFAAIQGNIRKGQTKADARNVVKELVQEFVTNFPRWRMKRREELGRNRSFKIAKTGRPTPVLAKILDNRRKLEIETFFSGCFTNGKTHISWVDNNYLGIHVDNWENWDGYSRQTKFPMKIWSISINAQKMLKKDMPGGRRIIDGLLTLSALQIPSQDGENRVWKAVWGRKAKGVNWKVENGYIVEGIDGEITHGKTIKTAIATLKRRRTITQSMLLAKIGINRTEALENHSDKKVYFRHARRAGLCEEGILSWAETHFPGRNPKRDFVTVSEILQTRSSESLALKAIAVAVN